MHSIVVLLLVGSFAYIGTMIDNLFAFAAQLTLTPRSHFSSTTLAQSAGVVVLVGLAAAVGSTLNVLPVRWVGVLALAPWALAWRNWRHRRDETSASSRRGAVTTFLITLGLGGDNLAVWIPLLRANGRRARDCALRRLRTLAGDLRRRCVGPGDTPSRDCAGVNESGRYFVPWLYVGLGFVILFECHVL